MVRSLRSGIPLTFLLFSSYSPLNWTSPHRAAWRLLIPAPTLEQRVVDSELVEYLPHDEVHEVVNRLRLVVETGHRGQNHDALVRESQHVLEVRRRQRRFPGN